MENNDLRLLLARAMHKGYWHSYPLAAGGLSDNDAEILEDWRGEVDEILAALADAKKVVVDADDLRRLVTSPRANEVPDYVSTRDRLRAVLDVDNPDPDKSGWSFYETNRALFDELRDVTNAASAAMEADDMQAWVQYSARGAEIYTELDRRRMAVTPEEAES